MSGHLDDAYHEAFGIACIAYFGMIPFCERLCAFLISYNDEMTRLNSRGSHKTAA